MDFGISTACMYPQVLEKSVEELGKMGVQKIELFFNTFSELEPDYLKELIKIIAHYHLTVVSCHPFTSGLEPMMFFSEYKRRLKDILELYRHYFDAMNQLGANVFVFHGDRKTSTISVAEYAQNFSALRDLGKSFGIIVTQENVERCKSGILDFITDLRKELNDDISFTLDLKQALRSGLEPMQVARAMGTCLAHIHLNDHDSFRDCMLPGFGCFPFEKLFAYLQEIHFCGTAMIEVYRKDYLELNELVQSINILKKLG